MLYDGFSTAAFVKQQDAILAATTQRLATTRENTALRSAQAYLEVLRRDQVVALSQVNLGAARRNPSRKSKSDLKVVLEPKSMSCKPKVDERNQKVRF